VDARGCKRRAGGWSWEGVALLIGSSDEQWMHADASGELVDGVGRAWHCSSVPPMSSGWT
jgi:hypothetical protein